MTTDLAQTLMNPLSPAVLAVKPAPRSLPRARGGEWVRPKHGPESGATPSLARLAARETAQADRIDTIGLVFLAGCALVAIAACASRAEHFLAGWSSFEGFVRSALG